MNNDILLCGHTGSCNRGCEAIVRSTKKVLSRIGIDNVSAMTFDLQYDNFLKLDETVEMISYPSKSISERLLSIIHRVVFLDGKWGSKYLYRKILENFNINKFIFNIGGDTYCYGEPMLSYGLNDVAQEKNLSNVLWGCSIDERALKYKSMQEDLNKYRYIICRESLTEEILKHVIKDEKKVFRACDPAFQLDIKETILPQGFKVNNTVGINLSPLVFKDYKNSKDILRQNVTEFIEWIIKETDMKICLIPHVYNIERNSQDIAVLNIIYNQFIDTDRVCIVNKELSCCELKYIISKCRFFIGARTHATIAAYSTGVPTIALSYSIKSRGIAKDLFGKEEGFAISYNNISNTNELKDCFVNNIYIQEECIRNRFNKIMPVYKQSIIDISKMLFSNSGEL